MRELNIRNYTVKVRVPDELNPGLYIDAELPYYFKDSLLILLFNPALQLNGADLVKQNVLAMRLEQCKGDEMLLEDEEYSRIKKAIDAFKGFRRNDVELVTRINEAKVVEVEAK